MFNKLILPFLLSLPLLSWGQLNDFLSDELEATLNSVELRNFEKANAYYANREYLFALPYYDTLSSIKKDNIYLSYLLGTCFCYDPRYYEKAEEAIVKADPIKSKLGDYDFFLGRALMVNNKYDEAIKKFEGYLKNPLNPDIIGEVNHQISICMSAKNLQNKAVVARITNIGAPLNSKGAEYCPLLPSDERLMVFTYRGEKSKGGKQSLPGKKDEKRGVYFEDIFISYKAERGQWSEPFSIDAINTNGHDAAIYISQDGQKMFIYRNVNAGNGDIYVSVLDGTTWSSPEKIKNINTKYWEGSVCLSPDQKSLYFTSEKPGGFGGRDIYVADLMEDGSWSNIRNLGPEVNTKFDEDAPFMHSDGKTLFFASTGHNSIGGYDIFKTEIKKGKWLKPLNLGKPVNTAGDDKFYVVSADGERGYYSSEKSSGYGSQDIYIVEPGIFGKPTALIMVTGKVTFDGVPAKADIVIKSKLSRKNYSGLMHSNGSTGDYLVNLPSGNEYELVYSYNGITLSKSLSTALVDSFASLEINAELFSDEYVKKNFSNVDSTQLMQDDKFSNEESYSMLLKEYGGKKLTELEFRVQLGAYRFIENFNYASLVGLPKVLRNTYQDGITRFTIGDLQTLEDADKLLIKARKKGIKDAFVIAIYNGKRIFFSDLLSLLKSKKD